MEPATIGAIAISTITLIGAIIAKIVESIKKDESGQYSFRSNCCIFGGTTDVHENDKSSSSSTETEESNTFSTANSTTTKA